MIESVLLFGDTGGVSQSLRHVPQEAVAGIAAAQIRPQYIDELAALAGRYAVPFLIQPRVASSEYPSFLSGVKDVGADLLFVNSYSMLLREDVLATAKYGAVNVHGALLPQYRGSNPIQWALINNEKETGVTLHHMDSGFDTGDIIAQSRVPIEFTDTWLDVRDRLTAATETLLDREMPRVLSLRSTRTKQSERDARHWRRRTVQDGRIDWTMSALQIYNLIRALVRPHPGAFYIMNGETVVVDQFVPYEKVVKLRERMGAVTSREA